MRCHVALALVAAVVSPSWTYGDEPAQSVAPTSHEPHGPQLPTLAEESREVVRLASALEPATAAVDQRALLATKLAELDRLQAEVQQLRLETQTVQSIYVSVEVLEVSLTKLRQLGMDFAPPLQGIVPRGFDDLLTSLRQNNVCKTLASPALVTISGRPASFFTGNKFAIPPPEGSDKPIDYVEAGIGLDVTAEAVGANRVRVSVKPRISSASVPMPTGEGQPTLPRLLVWQCATACEMEFGETFIAPGEVEERVETQKRRQGWTVETTEVVNEVARWVVVRVDDASKAAKASSSLPCL